MALKIEGMVSNGEEKVEELNYRGVKAIPFVIGNETFVNLGTMGTSANLLVYLTTVFNMKSISATNLNNIFQGTCNFGTLFGAFLSDTYFGRYKVLGVCSISSFLGMLMLALTSVVKTLHPHCVDAFCVGPTPWQMAFLLTGFMFLIIGASGIRPCNLAFGADQFNPNTESGQQGIASFFNWYYFSFNFALMVALTIIVYVQANISWAIGLAIPALFMSLSCVVFFAGARIYVKVKPNGSPLANIIQVLVAAIKKRKLIVPKGPTIFMFNHVSTKSVNEKLPYNNQLKFLNKAAIITPNDDINPDGSSGDQWTLCSIQQIEEVKCVIKTIPIWFACILYTVSFNNIQIFTVFQALQSDRRLKHSSFQIPAASYTVFQMLTLTVWVPTYDRLIVPRLRKITNKRQGISILQRIGVGIGIYIFTMLAAAVIETKRRDVAHSKPTLWLERGKGVISSMSSFWLVIQMVIAGLSEGFAMIGFIEFFYKQFPENMKSLAGSFFCCAFAMSSYLSSFLISIVHRATREGGTRNWLAQDLNEAKLDYFYYFCMGLEILNLIYFLMVARWYKYKGTGDKPGNVSLEDMSGTHKPMV
ncbi:protein NRT1/ PTR FAMILY 2.10-like [Bidens hawaiensis]|uniref:protein NRT1/ PTR FAMILY 2.10-like n=1 Tax=Bidens hawaiensis TaxID=980011 RepID=UPI004049773A